MKHPPLRIGLVLRSHGLEGAVRVQALTDYPDRFKRGARMNAGDRSLTISDSSSNGENFIIRFKEVDDRTGAESLVGHYLTLPLEEAHRLPDGSYYHFQLIGLRVVDADGQELGRVEEILTYPANDVLRVVRPDGKEVLVPMIRSVVRSIDPAGARMLVELPEEVEA